MKMRQRKVSTLFIDLYSGMLVHSICSIIRQCLLKIWVHLAACMVAALCLSHGSLIALLIVHALAIKTLIGMANFATEHYIVHMILA